MSVGQGIAFSAILACGTALIWRFPDATIGVLVLGIFCLCLISDD